MTSRYHTISSAVSVVESKNNFKHFFEIHDNAKLKKEDIPAYVANTALRAVFDNVIEHDNFIAKAKSDSSFHLVEFNLEGIDPSEDPRLAKWQGTVQARKKLQKRIQQHTGKRAEDVLFNRQTTIDEPNKQMLFRIFDTAERRNPTIKSKKGAEMAKLNRRCDLDMNRELNEIVATKTVPQPLEFVGVPQVVKREMAVTRRTKKSIWEQSEALDQRIENKARDIKRVLEFVPDVKRLQVTSTWTKPKVVKMSKTLVHEERLKEISSDTIDENLTKMETPEIVEEVVEPPAKVELSGVKINGHFYSQRELVTAKFADIQVNLQCDPHQRVVKTLLDMQNLGQKMLCCSWQLRRMRAQKGSNFDNNLESFEFIFDNRSFNLEEGEYRRFDVMFRPQCVGLFKQCWYLQLQHSPFCGNGLLTIRIQGLCTVPEIYQQRLDFDLKLPIKNYTKQLADRISLRHAELAVDLANQEPTKQSCPYTRTFDEREIFNMENISYKCERYGDLESLKELYQLMKKPRDPSWDFRVETLQQLILTQKGTIRRQTLQKHLVELLEPMKYGIQSEYNHTLENDRERQRSCQIYVRGAINNTIDDWENMSMALEQQFFKNEYQRQLVNQKEAEIWEESFPNSPAKEVDAEQVLKKVRHSKYFRDALYMQTYSLLCNTAEDIVSIIESTGHG